MYIGLFVLYIFFQLASAQNDECRCANQTVRDCSCYCHLENSLLSSDSNRENLTRSFFPITSNPAKFVVITYKFEGKSTNKVWYWGAHASYFLQPFDVFQYTSLLFGGSTISHNAIALELTLAPECDKLESDDDNMKYLTLRLKLYAESPSSLKIIKVTDSYYAQAYDKTTFTSALRGNSRRILIICICTSIATTVIATLIVVSVVTLIGCTTGHGGSFTNTKFIQKLKQHNPAIFAITVVSVFANVYMFSLSWTAMSVWEWDHFNTLISDLLDFDEINYINRSSIGLIAVFNTISLFTSVMVLSTIAILLFFKIEVMYNDERINIRLLRLVSVLCACLSVCAHSPYIAVAYLNDEYQATGIFIYYSLLGCLLFGLSWIAFHVYYSSGSQHEDELDSTDGTGSKQSMKEVGKCFGIKFVTSSNKCTNDELSIKSDSHKHKPLIIVVLLLTVFLTFIFFAVLTSFFIIIPINKSISEFPNRIVGIFKSGGFVISTYFLYKLFVYLCRKNYIATKSRQLNEEPQNNESSSQVTLSTVGRESTVRLEKQWRDRSESERKCKEYITLERIKDGILQLPARVPSIENLNGTAGQHHCPNGTQMQIKTA